VHQVADADARVLIVGETGTGKELIARALHEQSSRREAPLIAVNCGAITETLQESEFFGHEKGAFTGALARKIGKFQAAHGGTIFLDEISEMTKALQVKLLRILQSGQFAPVGMTTNQYCDVRVVAATNEDLIPRIAAGEFRKDLYYRLNIIRVELPPVRERKGDIPLLVEHFLGIFGTTYSKPVLEVDSEAAELLLQYDYPGNVWELENIIRRAVILCRDKRISRGHLPPEVLHHNLGEDECQLLAFHEAKSRVVEEFERAFLTVILRVCGGIVSRAAERSGLSERNFHAKLRKYQIVSQTFRTSSGSNIKPELSVATLARGCRFIVCPPYPRVRRLDRRFTVACEVCRHVVDHEPKNIRAFGGVDECCGSCPGKNAASDCNLGAIEHERFFGKFSGSVLRESPSLRRVGNELASFRGGAVPSGPRPTRCHTSPKLSRSLPHSSLINCHSKNSH
jgi:hypothetical protein